VFIALKEEEELMEITPQDEGRDQNFTSIIGAEIRMAANLGDAFLGSEIRRALRIATC